eukprot:scaffold153863_cov15-Tisochrysis_lutea.AAC.1
MLITTQQLAAHESSIHAHHKTKPPAVHECPCPSQYSSSQLMSLLSMPITTQQLTAHESSVHAHHNKATNGSWVFCPCPSQHSGSQLMSLPSMLITALIRARLFSFALRDA